MAKRHAIAPAFRVDTPEQATAAVGVLHATEPATVYLSMAARINGLDRAEVDRALYTDRTLIKQLAMRRTLFVFPRALLPATWASASARMAGPEQQRLIRDVEQGRLAEDGERWFDSAREAVLTHLDENGPCTAVEIREQVPEAAGTIEYKPDKAYGGTMQMSPRLLGVLAARAEIVRGENSSHWRQSKPRWVPMASWLGEELAPAESSGSGYRELVRIWLERFGPGTEADLVWWFGATKAAIRAALADVGAWRVELEGGSIGFVLPEDLAETQSVEPWAALLPVLDPSIMGWKERSWYLGDHSPRLFDRNGNAGTTVLLNGRVIGCWVQDDAGRVHTSLLEDVSASDQRLVDREAARLTEWLAGVRVGTVYPSPLMKEH